MRSDLIVDRTGLQYKNKNRQFCGIAPIEKEDEGFLQPHLKINGLHFAIMGIASTFKNPNPYSLMKLLFRTASLRAAISTLILTMLIVFSGSAQISDTTSYFRIASMGQAGKSISFVKKDTSVTVQATVADDLTQLWKWSKGSGSYFRITNQQLGSDLYLSVSKQGDDYKLVFSPKKDQSGQLWYANTKNGISRITCMWLGSDRLLEITKEGKLMMKEISMDMDARPTQLWKLIPATGQKPVSKPTPTPVAVATIPVANKEVASVKQVVSNTLALDTAAVYRIITTEMPEKSLGIGTIDGRIQQAMLVPALNQPLQEWKLVLNANGFYHITNKYYPSKSLEVRVDGANGDMVVINDTNNNKEQFWKFVFTHEGAYQISSVSQGDVRTFDFVEDGEEKNEIRLRDFNSTIWTFIRKSPTVVPKPVEKTLVTSTNKNRLVAGEQLKENAKLISANGEFSLVQQPDGNLVIYDSNKKAMWASGMNGQNVKRCVMQKDGNLVQHPGGYDNAMWSTNTKGNTGASAMLKDDGILVIINKDDKIIWSSKN